MVTLIGWVPPDEAFPRSVSAPPSPTENDDTSLLPALTTSSQSPSAERVTAPCEPSPAPVPVPPVATEPAATSDPSADRRLIKTELPEVAFVCVNTAPGALL